MENYRIKWHETRFLVELNSHLLRNLRDASDFILEEAKNRCPVDTGELKNSLGIKVLDEEELKVELGSEKDYAAYVELGTYKTSAQPYLRPALEHPQTKRLLLRKMNWIRRKI